MFISLLKEEALGFPAAEAMSSGCITVGFTGLGTEEYFDPSTGIPVPEGDVHALVEKVESVILDYDQNPGPYDEMRRRASKRIQERYSFDRFVSHLLAAWEKMERALSS